MNTTKQELTDIEKIVVKYCKGWYNSSMFKICKSPFYLHFKLFFEEIYGWNPDDKYETYLDSLIDILMKTEFKISDNDPYFVSKEILEISMGKSFGNGNLLGESRKEQIISFLHSQIMLAEIRYKDEDGDWVETIDMDIESDHYKNVEIIVIAKICTNSLKEIGNAR